MKLRIGLLCLLALLQSACAGGLVGIAAQAALGRAGREAALESAFKAEELDALPRFAYRKLKTLPEDAACVRVGENPIQDNPKGPAEVAVNFGDLTSRVACSADGYADAEFTLIGREETYLKPSGGGARGVYYHYDHVGRHTLSLTPLAFPSEAVREAHLDAARAGLRGRLAEIEGLYAAYHGCGTRDARFVCFEAAEEIDGELRRRLAALEESHAAAKILEPEDRRARNRSGF